MNSRLQGQVAIVTGAGSGIGAAVAIALAQAGAIVAVNHLNVLGPANEVVEQIRASAGNAFAAAADVSSEAEVAAMFRDVISAHGTVDILVANAGLQRDSAFTKMSLADWQFVLNVNLTGQFLCAREAAREFLRRGVDPSRSKAAGKIICMSSVHQVIPWGGHCNYAASKGGVMLFMKSIAQELAPHRIRVNAIGPGAIKTAIIARPGRLLRPKQRSGSVLAAGSTDPQLGEGRTNSSSRLAKRAREDRSLDQPTWR
jgi:glucose 1-dehydrogenase